MHTARQPKTTKNPNHATVRHLRVPDELWMPLVDEANESGLGTAELLRAILRERYVSKR